MNTTLYNIASIICNKISIFYVPKKIYIKKEKKDQRKNISRKYSTLNIHISDNTKYGKHNQFNVQNKEKNITFI